MDAAAASGVTIRAEAMVTGIEADRTLTVTTPQGLTHVRPGALVLATGARERPRSARMIAGDRPAGVYTTGHLQNLVHLQHGTPGQRAVVVGAELVSWSAVLTLREAGCRTVLLTTTYDRSESYRAFSALGRTVLRVPVAPRSRVVSIHGRHRVEAVTLEDLRTGTQRQVACDTVVLTGDWVPDNELARTAGLDVAPGSRSPVVDATLRTSAPGVFAVGNLVHPVDTAGVAALDGRHVAAGVRDWLRGCHAAGPGVPLRAEEPLLWLSPSAVRVDDLRPARARLLSRVDAFVAGRSWRCAKGDAPCPVIACRGPRRPAGSSASRGACSTTSTGAATRSPSRWPDRAT